jgi:DNA-binding CsgD family transcriptional regulator
MAEQAELTEQGAAHLDYAGALNALGMSLVATGEIEEGVATLRRALDDAIARGDLHEIAPAAVNLSESLHRVGRTTEALEVVRGVFERLTPLPTRQLWLSLAIAQYAFEAGDWDTAEQALTGLERRRFSSGDSELNASLRRAELALGRDEREPARRYLARAAELAADSRQPQYLGVLGALEAELATREGDAAAARAAVDLALDRIEFCSDDALRMAMASGAGLASEASAAQHARDLGDERAAADALVHAELLVARVRACAEDGGPLEAAYLAHAEADYCRALGADEVERWAEAAEAWDAMGRPYPAAIARWRQAEALVAAGDRDAAVEPACAAIAEAERLGAAWLSGELESLAARARLRLSDGVHAAAEADEDEDPFGLTPRERQVLALVAAGATNREIGKQLYMAEKTASVHVSRILAKLDVRSRTEAAGVAHRLGLDAVV